MIHFLIGTIAYHPVVSIVIILISAFIMLFGIHHIWRLLNILFTFTTKIENLKPGKVEIKGKIKAINTIPDINRKAVYYKKEDQYYKRGKNSGWKTDKQEEKYLVFKVQDSTGEIAVIPDSVDDFNIKHEIIKHSSTTRTKYFYLEDGEEVYVLGNMFRNNDADSIGRKQGVPFIISDYKEINLIMKHSIIASITIFLSLGFLALMLSLGFREWNKSWKGTLEKKYTYVSRSGNKRTTNYVVQLEDKKTFKITEGEYDKVKKGDYLIKHKESYGLEINGRKY
jgi:hypothetical protein